MYKKGLLLIFIILLQAVAVQAQTKYKKFDIGAPPDTLLIINLTAKEVSFTIKDEDVIDSLRFTENNIKVEPGQILINNKPVMTKEGFILGDQTVGIDLIDKINIEIEDESTSLTFLKASGTEKYTFKSRKKNITSVNEKINIEPNQFVRGSVISFWGDITVDGEVNEDVVAVFGNIIIGDKAIIRGHVAAIGGTVKGGKKATVYGNVMSSGKNGNYAFSKNKKGMMIGQHISKIYRLYYNRVDGIAPYFGFKIFENDTLIPEFTLYGGYGFASEQPRYYFGVEHSLWIPNELVLGGAIYKRLASDDDWIISELNNTIFALLATEDYKNYYDAQGGKLYAGYYPIENIYAIFGINYEKHRWLSARPELWSLSGGNKDFFANYSNLDEDVRNIAGNNSNTFKFFSFDITFKPPKEGQSWNASFWSGSVNLEWFPKRMNNDLEYSRILIKGKRQQRLNNKFVLRTELTIGGSGDSIPDYRKFSIGGMGTLSGFDRKEFTGTDFWLGNIELGLKPLKEEVLLWLLYDAAGIANSGEKLSKSEILHSLGVGVSLGDYIRLYTARRFDRANPDLIFGVKLCFSI
ncbi:MAG: hypothetical protein ABIJ45_09995 [Candidatus Zixiibacteriota bacterium]